MIIKTLQWNIGGGKIRETNSDPTKEESYRLEGLEYIEEIISKLNPDIITLQETHQNSLFNQTEQLAKKLGYSHYFNHPYDSSHLDPNYELGQGVISRYPIQNKSFVFFSNPNLEIVRPNGEKWLSHNKGISNCDILIEEKVLRVQTTHFVPFNKFKADMNGEKIKKVIENIMKKISNNAPIMILQGDFNYDNSSLKEILPDIFSEDTKEVLLSEPTTPKNRKYDHIVYRGLRHLNSTVIPNILTDHYPVYSEFE